MPKHAAAILAAALLVLAVVAPAGALEYEVRLKNGNVFHTRYEPVEAPFDASRVLLMTTMGNPITLPRESVDQIISVTEAAGFGKRLDRMTVLIGLAPNDNPTPEEEAEMAARGLPLEPPPPYTMPLVGEPDAAGGIPLQFLNFNTPPLGAAGSSGSPADLRRGGGGTQFVEPQTRD